MSIIKKIFSAILPGYRQLQKLKQQVSRLENIYQTDNITENYDGSLGFEYRVTGSVKNSGYNNVIIQIIDGKEHLITEQNPIHGLHIQINGNNNVIKIYGCPTFLHTFILISDAHDSYTELKGAFYRHFSLLVLAGKGQQFIDGYNTDYNGVKFNLGDSNAKVIIGEDCIFSYGIEIWAADGHSIVNKNGDIMNLPKPITIGNHCWIGANVKILKGSIIPNGSIVALGSIITGTNTATTINTVITGGGSKSGNKFWKKENCFYLKGQNE